MKFFLLLLQMIPAIIGIVRQIETAIPAKGKGAAKLDLVLKTVNTAAQASSETVAAIQGNDLNSAVTSIVNATVATMNNVGAFKQIEEEP